LHASDSGSLTEPGFTDTERSSVLAMIVSLQRRLDSRSDGGRERQFFSHVLLYLATTSGLRIELQNWMVTSYEVEFGPKIGSGGLYVFSIVGVDFHGVPFVNYECNSGQVFLGTWNNTQIALKVLVTETGTFPSSTVGCSSFLLLRY
jgi:hypothetical protein